MNYYNEFDPRAAAWLRELIKQGHIPEGVVDERSIRDVQPDDLAEYSQCHFFAGIGGWSLALRLAGVPDNERVWTGSCPCQPFSAAGKRKGAADDRHLWPDFNRLIQACKPPLVFGEQVDAAVRQGWLDGVFTDLEGGGYACGAVDLPAASVGAPHIRQRIFWVAHSDGVDTSTERQQRSGQQRQQPQDGCIGDRLEHAQSDRRIERRAESDWRGVASGCSHGGMANTEDTERWRSSGADDGRWRCPEAGGSSDLNFWSRSGFVSCRDSKVRRIEPGSFPLAHGVPARVGRLRGYGNAIVPQVASVFIEEAIQCLK